MFACGVTMTTVGESLAMFARMQIEMLLPSLTVYDGISKATVKSAFENNTQL